MEFPTEIASSLRIDDEGFITCSGTTISQIIPKHSTNSSKLLATIVNELGELSAKAQNLKSVITTLIKFTNTPQRLYIRVSENKVLGFIKVGEKKLFYHDQIGAIRELTPTCVLDFYVHETCQRTGIGKFLRSESRQPERLAYDRPSPKLIGFLKKHYGLQKFIPQNNNYVIFDRYFDTTYLDVSKPDGRNQRRTMHNFTGSVETKPPRIPSSYEIFEAEKRFPRGPAMENKQITPVAESNSLNDGKTSEVLKKITISNNEMRHEEQMTEHNVGKNYKNNKTVSYGRSHQDALSKFLQETRPNKPIIKQTISSFGCPWAIDQPEKAVTTFSNPFGNSMQIRRK